MELIVERPAALDVHKAQLTACVRVPDERGDRQEQIAEFATTVRGLLELHPPRFGEVRRPRVELDEVPVVRPVRIERVRNEVVRRIIAQPTSTVPPAASTPTMPVETAAVTETTAPPAAAPGMQT